MTSKEENKAAKDTFDSQKHNNTLGLYFKNEAWDADLDGETRVYVVKDSKNRIPLYFSLKCGLLFKKKNYGTIDSTLQVGTCYSAIELQHFCKNENYIPEIEPELLQVPFGFGIFWEVIVPEIFKITDKVGCKYLYLFAADNTENFSIQKLVHYYKNALKFYECQDDGINIIEPDYDENCYGLVQEISKLRINQEAVWEQYSDIFSINKERHTSF